MRKNITRDNFRFIMVKITGDGMADDTGHRFMTYEDAAKLLRIKPDSVRRRAASRHWPKRQGNDRKARVGIPTSIIPDGIPALTPDTIPYEHALREELATTKQALARMEGQAEATTARLIDLAADRDAWKAQAERLASDLRPVVPASLWSRIFGGN
ncbi:hypothetical protein [Sulfitobacter sp. F26169L]|uniref:hypothetical protein n=1 Tax=Sulfitobacter sp. F26169L TaxID=2996015 RepID=UPI002260F1EE|nr:hypothetical protein [Sulfitobacter sp. F26169L]